jgi:hypothetical protein
MTGIPSKCPSCQNDMVVSQLSCTSCETTVVGAYALSPFAFLSGENLSFLEEFIKAKGNVKEMEREMGQSYWVIRNRLDKVVTEMGFGDHIKPSDLREKRKEILSSLKDGEIDAETAAKLLTDLGESE